MKGLGRDVGNGGPDELMMTTIRTKGTVGRLGKGDVRAQPGRSSSIPLRVRRPC